MTAPEPCGPLWTSSWPASMYYCWPAWRVSVAGNWDSHIYWYYIPCLLHAWPCPGWKLTLIARFMWPTWGPPGADRTQVGPMWATWTLLSGLEGEWQYQNSPWLDNHSVVSTSVGDRRYRRLLPCDPPAPFPIILKNYIKWYWRLLFRLLYQNHWLLKFLGTSLQLMCFI